MVKITNLINAPFKLKYLPNKWKVVKVIMKVMKTTKRCFIFQAYISITISPKFLGFRENYSILDQIHTSRIINIIEKTLEGSKLVQSYLWLKRKPLIENGTNSLGEYHRLNSLKCVLGPVLHQLYAYDVPTLATLSR